MKKILAVLFVMIMVIGLGSCGEKKETPKADTPPEQEVKQDTATETQKTEDKAEIKTDKKILIGLSMHNQTADWAVKFKDTFLEQAKELGAEVTWNDANAVAATQVNNIEDLVAQGINVLVVVPADSTALGQALKAAADAGVKIINADSKVDEADRDLVESFITADCYKGGYSLGEYLADKLPENAVVGALNYPQIAVIADRFIGLQKAFEDKGRKDITIIDKTCTDLNAIATYTEDMFMANPEISAFVCLNDNTALSCYGTCAQMGHKDCLVYGFDGSPAGKQSIANGEMSGTMVYSPIDLAKASCNTAYAAVTGGKYEKETLVDMWLISPENIKERNLEAWE